MFLAVVNRLAHRFHNPKLAFVKSLLSRDKTFVKLSLLTFPNLIVNNNFVTLNNR
jgi:hypothetical protein